MIFYFIVLGLLAFLSICRKESKIVTILLLILLWVLLINNTHNADYNMYEMYYEKYAISEELMSSEPIFQLMCKFFYQIGFDYQMFLSAFFAIIFILIYLSLNKISNNKALVITCYAFFPLCLDAVQIRHFMAATLILYAFSCLIQDKDGKGGRKYLLFNLLAIGFHFSAGFFLPLFLAKKYSYKRFVKSLIIVVIIMYILIITDAFVNLCSMFLPQDKVYSYFISGNWKNNINGVILHSILQLIPLFMLILVRVICNNSKGYDEKSLKILDYTIFANIMLIYILPIYAYTTELSRVFRMFIIVDYIAITNILRKKIVKNDIYIYFILIILISILFYCLITNVGDVYDKTLKSIFMYNNLFK